MHLSQLNVDIALLQETHLRNADVNRMHRSWVGKVFHSKFNSKARGTAILLHKNIPFETREIIADSNGRYIIVSGLLFNKPLTLASIYAPNWDNEAFIYNFFSALPNVDSHALIIGGGINCTLNPELDRSSTRPAQPLKMAKAINSFATQLGLCDPWRFINPDGRAYSFFSPVHHTFSRIYCFFIDIRLIPLINMVSYHNIVISDHAPVSLELNFPNQPTPFKPWRLNALLLSEQSFVEFMNNQIKLFIETNASPEVSQCVFWEALKAFLRGYIISYRANGKKEN